MPPVTPNGPTDSDWQLPELAAALRDLHRALLEANREEYERDHGPVASSSALLHLVMHDPAFAWLRLLSALMVDLDEQLEEPEGATDDEIGALRSELEEMFSPAGPPEFWERLSPLLQALPVAMAYGRLRILLVNLPRASLPDDVAVGLHAQHRWAVRRRLRRNR